MARYLEVEVNYDGAFTRTPFGYVDGKKHLFTDVDWAGMDVREALGFLQMFIRSNLEKLYFCKPFSSLAQGLRRISTDLEYIDFIEVAYHCGCKVSMYVDHVGAEVEDWLVKDKEEVYSGDTDTASMGVIRTDYSRRAVIEEFRRMLLSCSGIALKVGVEDEYNRRQATSANRNESAADQKLVCVTSGVSFLGIAIVKQLLLRGYAVRIIVNNQEDIERLREMEITEEITGTSNGNNLIGAVVAKFNECQSLMEAFEGCCAVFHTTAFIDPSGLSGYSKCMAEIEAKAAKNIVEACAATSSVRNYVLTSSLLACIWRDISDNNLSRLVDHNTWSDESFCNDKKLWYALGKLKAERVSWQIANEKGLKLATICSGLVTGQHYFCTNPSSTIAYLKGSQDMYTYGLLATVDVNKLAKAHVQIYEEMKKTGGGRYVCFDKVIRSRDEVQRLEEETRVHIDTDFNNLDFQFALSNKKLDRLMSQVHRCAYVQNKI